MKPIKLNYNQKTKGNYQKGACGEVPEISEKEVAAIAPSYGGQTNRLRG